MGMFSWICSDTENSLICADIDEVGCVDYTKKAFLLVPKEFGGGSFKVDHNYEGYGVFYDENGNEHDAYDELAKWNGVRVDEKDASDEDERLFRSRSNAISLYFTAKDESKSPYEKGNYNTYETLKFPLKIVENECAYEDAEPCWDDPNQGWGNYSSSDEEDDDYYEEDYYDDDEEEVDEED